MALYSAPFVRSPASVALKETGHPRVVFWAEHQASVSVSAVEDQPNPLRTTHRPETDLSIADASLLYSKIQEIPESRHQGPLMNPARPPHIEPTRSPLPGIL